MEDNLTSIMEEQRKKMIEKFKNMSIKYVKEEKHELWHSFIDSYYGNTENTITSMEEIFNYMSQLTNDSDPENVADLFMRRTASFDNAPKVAKIVAFFSYKGEEFYQNLEEFPKNSKKPLTDKTFLHHLHELNNSEDIDAGLELFKNKLLDIHIGEYSISAIMHDNGHIKGLTTDYKPVIGEKIDNYYGFYIIEEDGTYQRYLIHNPNTTNINAKRQSTWGFITNERGKYISKITDKPEICVNETLLTLDEYMHHYNIYDNIYHNLSIIPILYEIYGLSRPINEGSKISTIQGIMYKEMQESRRLDKELK